MANTNERLHAIVHGIVQGVSFRHYTTQKARELNSSDRDTTRVFLYGAVSEEQSGTVTSIYNDIKIRYSDNKKWMLTNMISVSENGKAISTGGDSGCVVVDGQRKVIGLVVAGNSRTTYVMPIKTLLNKMKVQLI